MEKRREGYLDEIKGISILLVVFCHYVLLPSDSVVGNILMLVAWGAVPCFFMVSGGVLHNSAKFDWKRWGYRIIKTYIVLAVWKIIYFLYFWSVSPFSFIKSQFVRYLFFLGEMEHVSTGLLWFMYAYLMALFFLPVSRFLLSNGKSGERVLIFVAILLFTGGICIPTANMLCEVLSRSVGKGICDITSVIQVIPIGGNWKNMLFYFVIGAFFFRYHIQIKAWIIGKKWRWTLFSGLMLAGISGLLVIKFLQTGSIRWEGIYLKNGYDWIATGFLSIGLYLFFMMKEKTGVVDFCLQYVGRNTMGIYYMHWIVCDLFRKLWEIRFEGHYSVFYNLFKTGIVTGVCMIFIEIAKRIPGIKELVR
ncbi:MAG: acyltransferase [Bacilli bacterium]|nr:acyltransferase [Bacilli bacterium]